MTQGAGVRCRVGAGKRMRRAYIGFMSFSIRVRVHRNGRPSPKPRGLNPPRRKRGGDEGEGVMAEPEYPKPLSGGAAAALEYDS